jgi:hypothetical protein
MDISSNAFAIQSELSVTVDPQTGNNVRYFTVNDAGVETDTYFQGINISPGAPRQAEVLNAIKEFYNRIPVTRNGQTKYHVLKTVLAYFNPRPDIIEIYAVVNHAIYNTLFKTWAVKTGDKTILVARWDAKPGEKYDIDNNVLKDPKPDSVTEYFTPWIKWTEIDAKKGIWKATDSFSGADITADIPYIYYTDFSSKWPPQPESSKDTVSRISAYNPPYNF